VVSIALVASYLLLVISADFALREAALAQLFWEGFTV
jgi:hypothetical protein